MTTITISDPLPAGTYTLVAGTGPIPPIPPDPIPPQPIPPGTIILPWNQSKSWHSAQNGGMACQQTLIFSFTVPADAPAASAPTRFSVAQDPPGEAVIRQMFLSRVPGSFNVSDAITGGQGTTVQLLVLAGPNGNVQAGQTYYFNLRNWSTDLDGFSCTVGQNVNCIADWILP